MASLVWWFGSGTVFFAGWVAIVCGVALRGKFGTDLRGRCGLMLGWLGAALVELSAVPLPYFYYGVAGVVLLTWLVSEEFRAEPIKCWKVGLRGCVVLCALLGMAWEGVYRISPAIPDRPGQTVAIIGDSVTAGLGEERFPRWPQLIAQECRWEVLDLAVFGAKCHSAIEQAQQVPEAASVVILEIGGNDVLGGTSVGGFETSLTRLVQKVVQPGREVFLFELPLPPFYNGYGLAQRRVAARFDVRLIPRTVLMNVLAPSENTVDSIHLSEPGQRAFAEAVKRLRYRP